MADFEFRSWLIRLPMPCRTRARVLRRFGSKVGRNVRVHPMRFVNPTWTHLVLDDDVYIGHECVIDLTGTVEVGRGAVLAAGVALVTHQDAGSAHHSPTAARLGIRQWDLRIGQFAFIGVRAVVLASVGQEGVVGAGAVVVSDVPDQSTVVGVPARPIRSTSPGA